MSDSASSEEKPFLPRWARYILVPGFVLPLFVLAFIFVVQLAHDEARCPFERGETRKLSEEISVREDHRSCLWGVEDHRFSVIRPGGERPLGSRRFGAAAFAPGEYAWQAEFQRDKDEVHVHVHNPGREDADFREGTQTERAADKAAASGPLIRLHR
jgi:hypothetical protein